MMVGTVDASTTTASPGAAAGALGPHPASMFEIETNSGLKKIDMLMLAEGQPRVTPQQDIWTSNTVAEKKYCH